MSIKLRKTLTFAIAFFAVFTFMIQNSQATHTLSEGDSLWMRTSLPAPAQFGEMTFFWSINWWTYGDYKVQYTVYRPVNEYGQTFPNWIVDLKPFWADEVIVEFKVTEGKLEFLDSCYVFDQGIQGGKSEIVPHSFYFGFYYPEFWGFPKGVISYMPGEVLENEPPHGDPLFIWGPRSIQYVQNIRSDFRRGFEMSVDIRPGSFPNPINPSSKGVVPVAILGKPFFFPELFDPESVNLEGIPPLRYHYADEFTYSSDCDCAIPGSDGYDDMILHFDSAAIAEYLEHTGYMENQNLLISATWLNTFVYMGTDTIKIVPKSTKHH
jgi:hypothetical protein